MNDDWRLRIDFQVERHATEATERLESELAHDLKDSFQDRVIVSQDEAELFCYTDSEEQARKVEQLIRSLASEHGWNLETRLQRWHPIAEQWEDPDSPLPSTQAEQAVEHEELVETEREESAAEGYPEWEVRVQCASHDEAKRLSEQLSGEGIPNLRRWTYLLVGAIDEDSARKLAERLRQEAPADSTVTAEVSGRKVLEMASSGGRLNPFVVF